MIRTLELAPENQPQFGDIHSQMLPVTSTEEFKKIESVNVFNSRYVGIVIDC